MHHFQIRGISSLNSYPLLKDISHSNKMSHGMFTSGGGPINSFYSFLGFFSNGLQYFMIGEGYVIRYVNFRAEIDHK